MNLANKVLIAISILWLGIFTILEGQALAPFVNTWYISLPDILQLGTLLTLIATVAISVFAVLYNPVKHLVWKVARLLVGTSQRTYFMITGGNLGYELTSAISGQISNYPKEIRSGLRLMAGILSFPPRSASGSKSRMSHSVPTQQLPLTPGGQSMAASRTMRRNEAKLVLPKAVRFRNLFRPIIFQNPHIGYSTPKGKTCLSAIEAYANSILQQPTAKFTLFTFVTGDDTVYEPEAGPPEEAPTVDP